MALNAISVDKEQEQTTTTPPPPFLKCKGIPVYFDEDWDTGIGGGLWSTGLAMAKYFQHNSSSIRQSLTAIQLQMVEQRRRRKITTPYHHENHTIVSGISALELGSGNGFLSICLAALAGDIVKELVITDMEDHLALIEKTVLANPHIITVEQPRHDGNVQLVDTTRRSVEGDTTTTASDNDGGKNEGDYHRKKKNSSPRCCIMEHLWGEFQCSDITTASNNHDNGGGEMLNLKQQVQNGTKNFDFIFGSDVAYRDHLHGPLIASLEKFSHEYTVALIGVTMSDTKPMFFAALVKAGFRYDRIADHLMSSEFRGTTFGLFVIRRDMSGIALYR